MRSYRVEALRTTTGRVLLGIGPILLFEWLIAQSEFTSGLVRRFPVFSMFPVVVLASFLGGALSGSIASAIGALLLYTVWIEGHGWLDEAAVSGYFAIGLLVAWTHEYLHRREATLQSNEQRLRVALEAADLGTWELDVQRDVAVRSLRHDQCFGYSELQPAWGLEVALRHVLPEDRPIAIAAHERAAQTGILSHEVRVRWPDGSVRWISVHGRMQYDGKGRPTRIAGVVGDVTQQRQAEAEKGRLLQEAHAANAIKDQFLASLSHELRTPLNVVLGYVRMLGTVPSEADRERMLGVVDRNAVALLRLVEDLLDVQRMAHGKFTIRREAVALHAVTNAVVDSLWPQVLAKRQHLHARVEPVTVSGDAARLQQVLWNLLSNAIKFTPPEGCLLVAVAQDGDMATLTVEDSGEGIPEEFLPHVFDRFRQADASVTRRHSGMGLGLAIVRDVVEQHGGSVHAASEGAGRGARFTVQLPIDAGPG